MKGSRFILFILLLLPYSAFTQEETETIIITAEISEEEETPSKSVITSEEIESLPGASTPEIVANVMGVQLSKFGNDSQPSFITIRGSSPEQVLVLVNGKRLNSSQGGGVDLSTIPPETIEKIEVIRGGASAVYGGSAFGGIINIVTKDVESSYMTIKYEYNSENRNNASFNIYRDSETVKMSGNLDLLYSPGNYIFNWSDSERDNTDIAGITSSVDITKIFNLIEIDFAGSIYKSEKGVPGTVQFPTKNARMDDLIATTNFGINYNSFQWDLDYLYKFRNYKEPDNIYGAIDTTHNYNSLSTLLSYNSEYGDIELSGNYDYLESDTYDKNSVDRTNLSLYLGPEKKIYSLKINPSLRVDYTDKEALPSWNIGLSYPLITNRVEVKASGGSAYRLPSFNDLFWPETSFARGNQNLKNEQALIYNLDLLYNITDSLTLDTTFYYHHISNLIQWNPGANGVWSPQNIGSAEIKGIETEISYLLDFLPVNGYFEGRANYTYLSAINREPGILYGLKLINRAAHKGNLIMIYYSNLAFILSADLSYTGSRYTTSANTKLEPAYFLLDMNLSKEIAENIILGIYGKNILNSEYEDYRGYPVKGITLGITLEYRIGMNE